MDNLCYTVFVVVNVNQKTGAYMQNYTVYLHYDQVYDLTSCTADSAEEAIAQTQAYYNAHSAFADTTVVVYKAVAN